MSSRYTTHSVSDEKWYEEKCQDFLDGKCDSYGHEISNDKDESHDDKSDNKSDSDEK